jgi:hypothetical protein
MDCLRGCDSGKYDNLTNGDVIFVNESVATTSPQLTYVNDAGNAIIKVDNTCAFGGRR